MMNLLPGVPRVESPLREDLFALADEETRRVARDLGENGFAVIEFPDPEFDRVAVSITGRLRDDARKSGAQWGLGVRFPNAWQYDENVRRIACNQEVLALLARLYGRRAWPFQTLNFPFGTEQHFHSDAIHFSSIPERFMCGVWAALEDIDENSGPLEYYPGSHKWPIYTGEHLGLCMSEAGRIPDQRLFEPLWKALVEQSGIKPTYFMPKKGQALIWAANLLHGGSTRRHGHGTRWSQVTHYYFDDCAYYTPMFSDPFYGQIHFRNEIDISTGQRMPNMYNGHAIPAGFIHATAPRITGFAADGLPPGFDPDLYYAANPDVKLSGMGAAQHWVQYGKDEGRPLRPA